MLILRLYHFYMNQEYSGTLIQRQFLAYVEIDVLANLMLYQGLTFLGLKMIPTVHIPSL